MNHNKLLLLLFLTFPLVAFGQEKTAITETNLPDKTAEAKPAADSPLIGRFQDGISAILMSTKASSLMFDDSENNNIDRAVDSLKNNQIYTPEGEEARAEAKRTKEEEDALNQANKGLEENEKSFIYLSSIMYFTPGTWAVWINNQKITPELNVAGKEIYLKSIEKDSVKVLWTLSMSKWKIISGKKSEELAPKINSLNQVEVEFELRPNQTFTLGTNSVSEGRQIYKSSKSSSKTKNPNIPVPTLR